MSSNKISVTKDGVEYALTVVGVIERNGIAYLICRGWDCLLEAYCCDESEDGELLLTAIDEAKTQWLLGEYQRCIPK